MRTRTWAILIGVNVVVSALVILTILFIWQRLHAPAPPATTMPTSVPTLASTAAVAPTLTAPPSAPPSSQAPLVHRVQQGDTLGAIAQAYNLSIEDLMAANGLTDPNVLRIGQELIIPANPAPQPTPEPSSATASESAPATAPASTPLPTLTPSGSPVVEIGQVLGSGNLAAEVVLVRNRGGAVALEGWTLSDAGSSEFTLPAITLFPGAEVRLHSSAGTSTPTDLYWGRANPAWTGGALITLRDTAGNVVDTYVVP